MWRVLTQHLFGPDTSQPAELLPSQGHGVRPSSLVWCFMSGFPHPELGCKKGCLVSLVLIGVEQLPELQCRCGVTWDDRRFNEYRQYRVADRIPFVPRTDAILSSDKSWLWWLLNWVSRQPSWTMLRKTAFVHSRLTCEWTNHWYMIF